MIRVGQKKRAKYWGGFTWCREKYGQFAPMIGEKALLELFEAAIEQDFFSDQFLQGLGQAVREKLEAR